MAGYLRVSQNIQVLIAAFRLALAHNQATLTVTSP
jgi:hypothetical protein